MLDRLDQAFDYLSSYLLYVVYCVSEEVYPSKRMVSTIEFLTFVFDRAEREKFAISSGGLPSFTVRSLLKMVACLFARHAILCWLGAQRYVCQCNL